MGREPRAGRMEGCVEAGGPGAGNHHVCPQLCQNAQTTIYFNALNKQFKYYPSSIISNMVT